MIISGIYKIVNKINNKCYIGSSEDVEKRWLRHQYDLNRGKHHSIVLQRAYIKYGKSNLLFNIIEEIKDPSPEVLFKKEQEWIDKLKPEYNVGSVGGGDNISKHPNLEQIKIKHSNNLKKRWLETDFRKNQIKRLTGENNPNWKGGISNPICPDCNEPMTPYHKRCNSCARKGKLNSFFGKTHTLETKEKLRIKRLGQIPTNARKVNVEGKQYESVKSAARALNLSDYIIASRIKSKYSDYQYI